MRTRGSTIHYDGRDAADEKRQRVLEHTPRYRVGDTSAASPAGRKKSTENWSPRSNSARVAASKPLRTGQGKTIGVVTVANASFASPEYRFELIFD